MAFFQAGEKNSVDDLLQSQVAAAGAHAERALSFRAQPLCFFG